MNYNSLSATIRFDIFTAFPWETPRPLRLCVIEDFMV